jgi:Tfp pilus assembly protein PilO
MIFNSFFTQVFMAVVAGGIVLFYIKPAFTEIGILQNAVLEYQTELEKVNSTNDKLAELSSKLASVSAADAKSLVRYMPDNIDDVSVSRDIFIIAELSNVFLESVIYNGIDTAAVVTEEAVENNPIVHRFSINVSGSYTQLKVFFSRLEQNDYPLEVKDLKMTSSETGLIKAELSIVTYSHKNI